MLLRLQSQGQTQIGIKGAFVKFVKDHRSHIRQFGIIQNHAGKNTLGDDLDAGFGADPAFQPHAQADKPAQRPVGIVRKPKRCRPCCQPTGFQNQYFFIPDPIRLP